MGGYRLFFEAQGRFSCAIFLGKAGESCYYKRMTEEQKIELKKLFTAHPSASVLEWMVATPALDNNEVWDCYEEWQDE
jgi:hypothetical protein